MKTTSTMCATAFARDMARVRPATIGGNVRFAYGVRFGYARPEPSVLQPLPMDVPGVACNVNQRPGLHVFKRYAMVTVRCAAFSCQATATVLRNGRWRHRARAVDCVAGRKKSSCWLIVVMSCH
jgi:hypothetical protein